MIGELLVILAVMWPIALALTLAFRRTIAGAPSWSWAVSLAPLPALLAALAVPQAVRVELPWLLLGSRWEIDGLRRALLAAAALVWLLAGWQMRTRFMRETHRVSLQLGWLLALAGNVGVMLVHDVAGLYAFFALMSFSAYPMIVLSRTREVLAAGRVYLAMTVLGEVLILSGLLIACRGIVSPQLSDLPMALTTSPYAALATVCLWTGFGVKTAIAGLHLWLPGVYTHAPPPVSAVLGGAMINAGVLGLLVTLPLGAVSLPAVGTTMMVVGLAGAFGAALVGVTQRESTTVFGYSSISQMGLLMIPLGAAVHTPAIASAAVAATTLFAVHHGLAKASLFLGVDIFRRTNSAPRSLLLMLLLLVGLSLAGAPLTSGAAAKLTTKYALADVAGTWPWLASALSFAAVGTTALVLRALWCLRKEQTHDAVDVSPPQIETAEQTVADDVDQSARQPHSSMTWPLSWLVSVAVVFTGVWWLPFASAVRSWPGASGGDAIALLWPVALGSVLSVAAFRVFTRTNGAWWSVPAGDLAIPVRAVVRTAVAWGSHLGRETGRIVSASSGQNSEQGVQDAGISLAQTWQNVRTRLHVKRPASADATLRSAAPISFGVLILVVLLLLRW